MSEDSLPLDISLGSVPAHDALGVLRLINDAYIVLDREYRFVYANRAAERDMQKSLDEIRGRVHWEVFPASYDITAGQSYRAAAETKVPQHFTQHYHFEGYDIHMEMDAYPTNEGGVAVFWRDVTARVRAEAALEAKNAELEATLERLRESEAQARILFRGAPVPMWIFDVESYRILDVNEAAIAHYGWSRDEFRSLTIRDIRPPEDVAALPRQVSESLRGPAHRVLARHVTRDGRMINVEMTSAPVEYAGHPARMALAVDVTERVRAEAALRASEERYALAANATSNAIWEWEIETGRQTWSEGLYTIFGFAHGEVPPRVEWWESMVHPDDKARVLAGVQAALDARDGTSEWEDSYRFRRGDGEWAYVLDRASVMRDASGRAIRMIGAVEDVTSKRDLEDRLRQAQKMEAIGQLAGGIAHDFNNLLTVITGNLEFARQGLPPEHELQHDLGEIAGATDRARGLVRQLLTFSRKQPVTPRLVQVGDVVRGMERLLRRVIGEEVELQVHIADGKPAVFIDPGQLEQVLMNLVVNARDAILTPGHGHTGEGGAIAIEVTRRELYEREAPWATLAPGCYVQLVVRDTGHGMDTSVLEHLFEPFFTTKDVGQGTGLGLATAHGIVTQAGGAIRAESIPGQGTTFTILFPAFERAAFVATPEANVSVAPANAATLLIVEDEATVRAIIRRTLELRGYRVLEARHGVDALMLWERHRGEIDAVVTDVRMPEMGGRELVTRLRVDRAALPVVFLSGYSDQEARAALGTADRFVEKPFFSDALIAALDSLLSTPNG